MSWAKKWQNFSPSTNQISHGNPFFLARDYCENNNSSKRGKGGTVKLLSFFAAILRSFIMRNIDAQSVY